MAGITRPLTKIGLLDLEGTELVVLSACDTGLGDIRTGEGVAGLRRAFLYAGGETLVTSLYKVPDEATQKLMDEFYTGLAAGKTKLESLRGAQREIIRQRREEHGAAHPFYWASFILVGQPE
ncbi:MAG: CHAT domain-containing protein [Phycisphaerales bacterium]